MRGERTQNIPFMLVTLDVSKLSGWLKANAACRAKGRYATRGEVCADWKVGELKGVGQRRAQAPRTLRTHDYEGLGGRARARRAHLEHPIHIRYSGRVEVQRLVKLLRALPSRWEGMRRGARRARAGRRAGAIGREAAAGAQAPRAHARGGPTTI